MRMQRLLLSFAAAVMVLVPAAQAQGPVGMFPWWEGQTARELNLTDAQRQQVESVQREFRAKMIDQRASVEKAELVLEEAMNADPFDLRKATDAANKVADARHELTRSLGQMGPRLRAVLTKEQWDKARTRFRGPQFGRRGDGASLRPDGREGRPRRGPGRQGPGGGTRPDGPQPQGAPQGGPGAPGGAGGPPPAF